MLIFFEAEVSFLRQFCDIRLAMKSFTCEVQTNICKEGLVLQGTIVKVHSAASTL